MTLWLSATEPCDAGLLLRADREWLGGQRRAQFSSKVTIVFDLALCALTRGADTVGLRPKTFDVLRHLVAQLAGSSQRKS
jgi:hypothetical protein